MLMRKVVTEFNRNTSSAAAKVHMVKVKYSHSERGTIRINHWCLRVCVCVFVDDVRIIHDGKFHRNQPNRWKCSPNPLCPCIAVQIRVMGLRAPRRTCAIYNKS